MRKTRGTALAALAIFALAGAVVAIAEDAPEPAPFGASARPMPALEKGYTRLYDGKKLDGWTMAGPGRFAQLPDGSLRAEGGMGLLWYSRRSWKDFVLRLDWKAASARANSGVFVRFPNPNGDPWKPVNEGYEIQISDEGDPLHRTGAVYTFGPSSFTATRSYGQWNTMEIRAVGAKYTVWVNDQRVSTYVGDRSLEGYIGLQNHDPSGQVIFRNIRIKPL